MSMDNRTLFTGKAADYAAARPSYAPALIDILYARHAFHRLHGSQTWVQARANFPNFL